MFSSLIYMYEKNKHKNCVEDSGVSHPEQKASLQSEGPSADVSGCVGRQQQRDTKLMSLTLAAAHVFR